MLLSCFRHCAVCRGVRGVSVWWVGCELVSDMGRAEAYHICMVQGSSSGYDGAVGQPKCSRHGTISI